MIRTKVICELCGQEISKSNVTKHLRRHQNHPETFEISKYKVNHSGLNCQFCGKLCKNKNSLCNHERQCKENPDRQVSGFTQYNMDIKQGDRSVWNKGLTKDTNDVLKERGKKLSERYRDGNLVAHNKGKNHSDETRKKISDSMTKFLEAHPDRVPYVLNHSSKESYPETYFKEFFSTNHIETIYHYRINRYELDFAVPSHKVDIEIDGDQHYLDKRQVESDKRRDSYLESLGWYTFRIRWSLWKTSEDYRNKILQELKDILG